ncbi:MAG: TetR/AcrR family transcriptional regulator [Rhizobiaceae bacterium]|nr:TetR/AcrR family transcriptional regulator [Rhizobiaceae bacterium]
MTILSTDRKPRQRAPSKKSLQTRERILDAAENLFAQRGFEGASIRDIAEAAGVPTALVNFHGGPKDALYFHIVERRAKELSDSRLLALQRARERNGDRPLALRDVLACFIMPYLEKAMHEGAHWRAYARLVAQVSADERWKHISQACFDPTAQVFVEELSRLYPQADKMAVSTGFVFSVASMLTMSTSLWRMEALGDGAGAAALFEERAQILLQFCEHGLDATLGKAAFS